MSNKKPDYLVKVPVQRTEGGKTYLHTIGAAWLNGDSINLQLDSLPCAGRAVLFKPETDADQAEGGAA